MILGGGNWTIESRFGIEKFSLQNHLPVVTSFRRQDLIDNRCENFIGTLGTSVSPQLLESFRDADVILAVGARFDDRVTNTISKFCPQATIIHIDVDPASISKTVISHLPIVGPARPVLEEMLSQIKDIESQPGIANRVDADAIEKWWTTIDDWRQKHGLYTQNRFDDSSEKIKPQEVVQLLHELTDGKAFVTSDVGQHQMFAAQYYHFDEPRKWINSGGLGTMGFGLPAAIGVKLAYPKEEVVCITGEGSIQMCIQELSTCTQYLSLIHI